MRIGHPGVLQTRANLYHALAGGREPDTGAVRETFFLNMLRGHTLSVPARGDFLIDDTITCEIGGKGKGQSEREEPPTDIHSLMPRDPMP